VNAGLTAYGINPVVKSLVETAFLLASAAY
jgi:hypothetical protein